MSDESIPQGMKALEAKPVDEVTADAAKLDPETDTYLFDNDTAAKIVLQDAEAADNYLNINQWASGWTLADLLYQSPASSSAFEGGNVAQANVPKFMVSNHISAIVPKLMGGIFFEEPPFLLRPFPDVTQDVIEAKTAIFTYQLNDMKFEEECERALEQMALLGTCVMKWGYTEYKETIKTYRHKSNKLTITGPNGDVQQVDTPDSDEFEIVYEQKLRSRPWIKYCDVRTVLVDPGCRYGDIRRAKWVIYRDYATFDDLNRLRGVEGYHIPSEADLKRIFFNNNSSTHPDNITMTIPEGMWGYLQHARPRNYKTSADPKQNGMEILERWDDEKVVVLLCYNNHNFVIRNEANPYGKKPFLSANWRNIPDCFYGQGLGILIGSEQMVEQGVTNLALDLLAYGLQPSAVRKKGFNTPTQNTRWGQGRIIDVDDDVDKSFKFLTMPPVPGEAWQFIQQAQSSGAATSGANENFVQGASSPGVHTTGTRSGTGAAAVVQANASRLDGPDGRFIRQVFEPWLYIMDDLNNDMLPASVLRDVLGEKLGPSYSKIDHIKYRGSQFDFEVLAGAHLGPKAQMAQFLPQVIQLMNNPTIMQNFADGGYKIDGIALFKAMTDLAGWKFSQPFLVQMSDQERASHEANKPAAIAAKQLQAQQQMQVTKFQQEEALEDQRQLGKAGNEVLRQTTQHALNSEITGQPSPEGFGSTTAL